MPAWNSFAGSDDLSSTVLSSTRGPDRYIYLGGRDGLYRVEGGGVRAWFPDFTDPTALPAGRINALASTEEALWIGTEAGLTRYHPETDSFETFPVGEDNTAHQSVSALKVVDQRLWVGAGNGVFLSAPLDEADKPLRFSPIPGAPKKAVGIIETETGIFVGGADGLYRRHASSRFERVAPETINSATTSIAAAPDGSVWVATADKLFHSTDNIHSSWEMFQQGALEGLPDGTLRALTFDGFGRLWIGGSSGLSRWDLAASQPTPCRSTTTGSDRDQRTAVGHLSGDLGPYMFMGTLGRGATYAPLNDDIQLILPGGIYNRGLPDTAIWSTAFDPQERLLIGTNEGLFREIAVGTRHFQRIGADLPDGVRIYSILSVGEDDTWVGSNQGLFIVDGEGTSFVPLLRNVDGEDVKPSVFAIKPHQRGVALGTSSGLILVDRNDHQVLQLYRTNADHQAPGDATTVDITGDRVWSLDVVGDQILAAGNDVALEVNPAEARVVASTTAATERGDFTTGRIFTIIRTDNKRVLLGTESGLIETSNTFQSFKRLSAVNGLRLRSVMASGRSSDGAVWLGAAGLGLLRHDPMSGSWRHLSQSDGLITNGVSQLGLSFSPHGHVVVSNGTGASVVDAAYLSDGARTTTLPLEAEERLRNTPLTKGKRLVLDPENRDLRVHFKIPDLLESGIYRIRYQFRGENEEATIQTLPLGEDLSFARLAPGTYQFNGVLESTSEVQSEPLDFSVQVNPFWWERQSVRYAAVSVGIIGLMAIYRTRSMAVENRYALIADERKRIAQDLHDTFLQDVFAARMIGNSLVDEQERKDVRSNTQKMLGLLESATGSVRTSVQQLSQLTDVPPLSEAIRRCEVHDRYGVDIAVTVSENGRVWPVASQRRFFLARIVQEAINNSCKHSRATEITICLTWSWHKLDLTVTDNGRGFHHDTNQLPPGFGLGAMKRMAEAANADFALSSKVEHGTSIALVVPRLTL